MEKFRIQQTYEHWLVEKCKKLKFSCAMRSGIMVLRLHVPSKNWEEVLISSLWALISLMGLGIYKPCRLLIDLKRKGIISPWWYCRTRIPFFFIMWARWARNDIRSQEECGHQMRMLTYCVHRSHLVSMNRFAEVCVCVSAHRLASFTQTLKVYCVCFPGNEKSFAALRTSWELGNISPHGGLMEILRWVQSGYFWHFFTLFNLRGVLTKNGVPILLSAAEFSFTSVRLAIVNKIWSFVFSADVKISCQVAKELCPLLLWIRSFNINGNRLQKL